jgi:hypothetical protein
MVQSLNTDTDPNTQQILITEKLQNLPYYRPTSTHKYLLNIDRLNI